MTSLSFIPTPSFSQLALGPFTIHFYALCILLGIIAAIFLSRLEYRKNGGNPGEINELAVIAVPAGIVGGRLYHVITTPDLYFGAHGHLIDVVKIWQGGMGIWGAISAGALAIWLRTRSAGSFLILADAVAPGLFLAQAIGRWGNWFNGELFGRPTTVPWGLAIPEAQRPVEFLNFATFHPTFLYESMWCLFGAFLLLRFQKLRNFLGVSAGQRFLTYIFIYSVGRLGIETLRIDAAHTWLGWRVNIWVALILAVFSLTLILVRRPAREKRNENR